MRDLYTLGDLPRPESLARRDVINAKLSTLRCAAPPRATRPRGQPAG